MTNLIEQQHHAPLTLAAEEKHIHTLMVKVADKATGLSKRMTAVKAMASNRSVHLQVDTDYTSTLPFDGVTGSDVWVESGIEYITRNDAMLSEMKDGLESLYPICCDIT